MAASFDVKKYKTIYTGSVKNLREIKAPTDKKTGSYLFEYTDDFSVFDYGKMPDKLPGKGAAMAVMTAYLFEQLEAPATWKKLARSDAWKQVKDAAVRDRLKKSAAFRELKKSGLPTHYKGLVTKTGKRVRTADLKEPTNLMEVESVAIRHPEALSFGGRQLYNYNDIYIGLTNFLVPLECIFRFGVPNGSSLLGRLAKNPDYAKSIGLAKVPKAGDWLKFPVVEFTSKLEPADRILGHELALNFSGLTGKEFQALHDLTCLVAVYLTDMFAACGVKLWDGKFEFLKTDALTLGDAITPDELRLTYKKAQISKEPLRQYYKRYDAKFVKGMDKAKDISAKKGGGLRTILNRQLGIKPQKLDPVFKLAAANMYAALTGKLTGLPIFEDAGDLKDVLKVFKQFKIS